MRRFVLWVLVPWLGMSSVAAPARADDTADEADLRFNMGVDAYERGDFSTALSHFLASNRLVPNKNVLYNVARAYEKLGRYPEAYRYYLATYDGETDAAARARLQRAMDELSNKVAVVEVETNPPGATVYVDRKDLGPRGETPRRLGLSAGNYEVIVEKPGYEPARRKLGKVPAGGVRRVKLELVPILGKVRLEGGVPGARARVSDGSFDANCALPCTLQAPPGRRQIAIEHKGFRTRILDANVVRDKTVTLRADLDAITGSLVVSTDEAGALVEIDDKPAGFTPALIKVPVGKHVVRISLPGHRPVERELAFEAEKEQRLNIALSPNAEVIAASREAQSIEDAPGSVSVVPYRELKALAYPTVAEALRGVRGVYLWDDRSYQSIGVRGLGRLGSYGNRLLVLIDGHPTNDNWIGSSYVGYDARTDLADLERVEIVRGPGSVLYGTGAFTGVINLVTRRASHTSVEMGVGTSGDGVARARARGNLVLGRDAGVWTSVGVARSSGRDFFFPEYVTDTPPEVAGNARDVDGFSAVTASGRAWWKSLTAQWFFHTHEKRLPTGVFETVLNDDRTRQRDTRAFLEVRADPRFNKQLAMTTRVHANHYRFEGDYARDVVDGGVETDRFRGTWVGLEQRVVFTPLDALKLTVGAEGQLHLQVEQEAADETGSFLDETGSDGRPYQVGAGYLVTDVSPSRAVHVSLGARLDAYSTFGQSVNPRVALITRPYSQGVLKVMGGKAFRAPSIYELFYNDGGLTQIASPELQPENIYSAEIEHSHRFSPKVTGTLAAFGNYTTRLIDFEGAGTAADPLVYSNSDVPLAAVGAEAELRREFSAGWMVAASYGFSFARFLRDESGSALLSLDAAPDTREVANAPQHLASVKAAAPIWAKAVTAATRLTFEGIRFDRFEAVGDPPQGRTRAHALWDLVLSGFEARHGLGWAVGVYNAFDYRYSLPVSAEFRQRAVPQQGRSFLASVELTLR
ncbi:MAG: TonB-dependent receptor [Polyangiaceae bacterium]